MKLPADIKQKWVDALRSGEYKQGQGYLKTEDGGYCCLGVLQMCTQGYVEMHEEDNTPRALPTRSYWSKIRTDLDYYSAGEGLEAELTHMNDGGGTWTGDPQSFEQIADFIEKNVEAV